MTNHANLGYVRRGFNQLARKKPKNPGPGRIAQGIARNPMLPAETSAYPPALKPGREGAAVRGLPGDLLEVGLLTGGPPGLVARLHPVAVNPAVRREEAARHEAGKTTDMEYRTALFFRLQAEEWLAQGKSFEEKGEDSGPPAK
jgi:hypothetical protein